MEFPAIKCDLCGRQKGETNHWLTALISDVAEMPAIVFGPIDIPAAGDGSTLQHICSHACAMKRFSQWLGTLISTERQS